MPLYEYLCAGCGTRTEKLMSISQMKPSIRCPKCKKTAKKTIGSFAVHGLGSSDFDDLGDWGEGDGMDDFGGEPDWDGDDF